MNIAAIQKMEIVKELSFIPKNKLDKVKNFIESILMESKVITMNNCMLQGIWKDKGFDKIRNLESEIKGVRKQLGNSILGRKI